MSAALSRVEPAAGHHGLRAALLERSVVEVSVWTGVEDLEREWRRLGQVARNDADRAAFESTQELLEAFDVHGLFEAVVNGLADERVVGDLQLARQVLGAGDLVGKYRGEQILRGHAGELRGDLLAAAEARQGQRDGGAPAPARGKHRRGAERLHEQGAHGVGMKIARDFGELEAVHRRE